MVTAEVGDDMWISDRSFPAEGDAVEGASDSVLFMVPFPAVLEDPPRVDCCDDMSLFASVENLKAPTPQVTSPTTPSPSFTVLEPPRGSFLDMQAHTSSPRWSCLPSSHLLIHLLARPTRNLYVQRLIEWVLLLQIRRLTIRLNIARGAPRRVYSY